MRVLSHIGAPATEAIKEAMPDVSVVEYEPDATEEYDGPADTFFAPGRAPGRGTWDELISQCRVSGIRWVHIAGAGVGDPPPEFFEDGRVLTCSRGAFAGPIAEFTLAAMLAFEQRHPSIWVDAPPEGAWGFPSRPPAGVVADQPPFPAPPRWGWAPIGSLDGGTLGLIGFGGIAQRVARHAVGFGMDVIAVRRRREPSPIAGVRISESLEEVLEAADHLVVAAAGTPSTDNLLDADALRRVGPGLHLVNVARGSLIDQDALIEALDDGRVALATLDVAQPEPLPAGHPLYAHPRVNLSPHVSWCSPAGNRPVIDLFVANLRRYVADEPLTGVVDSTERY